MAWEYTFEDLQGSTLSQLKRHCRLIAKMEMGEAIDHMEDICASCEDETASWLHRSLQDC